jgi:hypothetical protein
MTASDVIDAMEDILREVWPTLNDDARHRVATDGADAYLGQVDEIPPSVGRRVLAVALAQIVSQMIDG